MKIATEPTPEQSMMQQQQQKNVEYFNILGGLIADVQVKLNQRFPCEKQHSTTTKKRIFSPGNGA
jgi:hypothetical protein